MLHWFESSTVSLMSQVRCFLARRPGEAIEWSERVWNQRIVRHKPSRLRGSQSAPWPVLRATISRNPPKSRCLRQAACTIPLTQIAAAIPRADARRNRPALPGRRSAQHRFCGCCDGLLRAPGHSGDRWGRPPCRGAGRRHLTSRLRPTVSRLPDQMAQAGMDCAVAVSGRDCSARQITPPGPTGNPNRSSAPKCRTSFRLGDAVFLISSG